MVRHLIRPVLVLAKHVVAIGSSLLLLVYAVDVSSQCITDIAVPSDANPNDFYGFAVEMYGNEIAVGAYGDDDDPGGSSARMGSVRLYTNVNGQLQFEQFLPPTTDGHFGESLAMSSDVLVVGGHNLISTNKRATAVVYRKVSGLWVYEQTLKPSYPSSLGSDQKAIAIAIEANRIVLGIPGMFKGNYDYVPGAVIVYVRTEVGWEQEGPRLYSPNEDHFSEFGASVSISDGVIAVGEPRGLIPGSTKRGAVHLLTLVDEAWTVSQTVHAYGSGIPVRFGTTVVLEFGDLLVSDPKHYRGNIAARGGIFRFQKNADVWNQITPAIYPPVQDEGKNIEFGAAAAKHGTALLASAGFVTYLYRLNQPEDPIALIPSPSLETDPVPPRSISLYGDWSVLGAHHAQQAEVVLLNGPDCNGNRMVDQCDPDCDGDQIPDDCVLTCSPALDCNFNQVLDSCELNSHPLLMDSDGNGIPDRCDQYCCNVDVLRTESTFIYKNRMDVQGHVAIVGAPFDGNGKAQVYRFVDGHWTEDGAPLVGATGDNHKRFGSSVAIHGDLAVVGEDHHKQIREDTGELVTPGAVNVFRRVNGLWTLEQKLEITKTANDFPHNGQLFGAGLDTDGNKIVIGSPGWDLDTEFGQGRVYVYSFNGTEWSAEAKVHGRYDPDYNSCETSQKVGAGEHIGSSVALDGSRIAFNAPGHYLPCIKEEYTYPRFKSTCPDCISGAVGILEFDGNTWHEVMDGNKKLRIVAPTKRAPGDAFGHSVDLLDGRLLIGAPSSDIAPACNAYPNEEGLSCDAGAAYVFEYDGSAWLHKQTITLPDLGSFPNNGLSYRDYFGYSVVLDTDVLYVSAPGRDIMCPTNKFCDNGAVYRFENFAGTWEITKRLITLDHNLRPGRSLGASGRHVLTGHKAAIMFDLENDAPCNYGNEISEEDCNENNIEDTCELGIYPSLDCNGNGIIDSCELKENLVEDCNKNGVPDECDINYGVSKDCNDNDVPDECDLDNDTAHDCNQNGHLDSCDLESGTSKDCNGNGTPDECEIERGFEDDCNQNSVPDTCDISNGTSLDCNANLIPDECDMKEGDARDCNGNDVPDRCDILSGEESDCNANWIPDSCELDAGDLSDCDANGTLDICENGVCGQVSRFAHDGTSYDRYGSSVSAYGDVVAIGAPYHDVNCSGPCSSGSVYIYRRASDGYWKFEEQLSGKASGDRFGYSVSLYEEWLAVGAPWSGKGCSETNPNCGKGAVHLFKYVSGTWMEVSVFTGPVSTGAHFGTSVSLDALMLGIGAPEDEIETSPLTFEPCGSAHLYQLDPTEDTWTYETQLVSPFPEAGSSFGRSVDVEGTALPAKAIVGAYRETTTGGVIASGNAYVFLKDDYWGSGRQVNRQDAHSGDAFGYSVAVDGNLAVVGQPGIQSLENYVYLYDLTRDDLAPIARHGKLSSDQLGYAVDISGINILAGAPRVRRGGPPTFPWTGAARLFRYTGDTLEVFASIHQPTIVNGDLVGYSVGLSANSLVVGVPGDDTWLSTDRGSAIIQSVGNDCNGNGQVDSCEGSGLLSTQDCNENGIDDVGELPDCNENDIPDECEFPTDPMADTNDNLIHDDCESELSGVIYTLGSCALELDPDRPIYFVDADGEVYDAYVSAIGDDYTYYVVVPESSELGAIHFAVTTPETCQKLSIEVTPDSDQNNVNFTLACRAIISGKVMSCSEPLRNIKIAFIEDGGGTVTTTSDSHGFYCLELAENHGPGEVGMVLYTGGDGLQLMSGEKVPAAWAGTVNFKPLDCYELCPSANEGLIPWRWDCRRTYDLRCLSLYRKPQVPWFCRTLTYRSFDCRRLNRFFCPAISLDGFFAPD